MQRMHLWRIVLLIAAVAGVYLVGNGRVGLFDRDEPRYAQTAKQMLQSDPPDWVVPRLLDQVRTAKPVFIYWCQATSMRFLGTNEFAARLPSAVAMVMTLCLLAAVLWRSVGPERAVWTVFIFATCGLVVAAAKMCITDSVLLLWIAIAQLCLCAIYHGRRSWGVVLTMWLAVGLAGLTKGPVVLGVQVTTLIVLACLDLAAHWHSPTRWRDAFGWWKHTRPLVGIVLVAAIVAPWLWSIEQRSPGFLRQTILHDIWTRSMTPLEGHGGPPGFYLLTIWGTYFPWSLLLPTAATIAWKSRADSKIRFALAAVIGPWVMMEFVQTKLVHYVMPAFPALAFLTADALVRCIKGERDDLVRPIAVVVAGVWAVMVALAGSVPWVLVYRHGSIGDMWPVLASMSVVGLIFGAGVFNMFRRKQIAAAGLSMGLGMMAVAVWTFGIFLPRAEFMWVPKRVAAILHEHGGTKPGDVIMIDFTEDSLAYYQGGTIRRRDDDYLKATPLEQWPTWVVLTQGIYEDLPGRLRDRLEIVGRVRGWAYADGGRAVEVLVARKLFPEKPLQ